MILSLTLHPILAPFSGIQKCTDKILVHESQLLQSNTVYLPEFRTTELVTLQSLSVNVK